MAGIWSRENSPLSSIPWPVEPQPFYSVTEKGMANHQKTSLCTPDLQVLQGLEYGCFVSIVLSPQAQLRWNITPLTANTNLF